jgi:serine/threonine protein kinase
MIYEFGEEIAPLVYRIKINGKLVTNKLAKIYKQYGGGALKAYERASYYNIGPKIYDEFIIGNNKHVIIMEFIQGMTLTDYFIENNINTLEDVNNNNTVKNKLYQLYKQLYDKGINYTDKKSDNIIVKPNGDFIAIDFDDADIYNSPIPESKRNYNIKIMTNEAIYKPFNICVYHTDPNLEKEKKLKLKQKIEDINKIKKKEMKQRLQKRLNKLSKN